MGRLNQTAQGVVFFSISSPHLKLDSVYEDIAAGEDCTIVQ